MAADPDWRLIVVDGPRLIEWDGVQALAHWSTMVSLDPLRVRAHR
jgi:hypothetical protein